MITDHWSLISQMPNGLFWRSKCISGDQCLVLLGLLTCNWWFLISNHCFLNIIVKIIFKIIFKIIAKVIEPPYLRALVGKYGWYFSLVSKRPSVQRMLPLWLQNTKHIRLHLSSWNIRLYLDFWVNWTHRQATIVRYFWWRLWGRLGCGSLTIAIDFSLYSLLTDTWIGARRLIQPSSNSKL